MYNENWAKIAVNKSLLKEYSNSSNERIVYMNDSTEFQIQIFNPNTFTIGVSFNFNEEYSLNFSQQLLVLRPGERIWLDRYLTEKKKLLFSTYEVGDSIQVQEAIRNNGKLEIKFFKEYKKNYFSDNSILISKSLNNDFDYNPQKIWYSYGDSTGNSIKSFDSAVSCNYCSSSITQANADSLSLSSAASTNISQTIETGRIEKGGYSKQDFKNVNMDFETWAFRTETIHIFPSSQKPITKKDLTKKYCYNCGKKIAEKFKYCPNCGAKQ